MTVVKLRFTRLGTSHYEANWGVFKCKVYKWNRNWATEVGLGQYDALVLCNNKLTTLIKAKQWCRQVIEFVIAGKDVSTLEKFDEAMAIKFATTWEF